MMSESEVNTSQPIERYHEDAYVIVNHFKEDVDSLEKYILPSPTVTEENNEEFHNLQSSLIGEQQNNEHINIDDEIFISDDEDNNNRLWDVLDTHLKEFACPKQQVNSVKTNFKNDDKIVSFPDSIHTTCCTYIKVPGSFICRDRPFWYNYKPERHVARLVVEETYTRLILRKLINMEVLENVDKLVSIGNESILLHGNFNTPINGQKCCAIKVFKTKLCKSTTTGPYVNADCKFEEVFVNKNTRQVVRQWAKKEFDMLIKMESIGVHAPKPIYLKSHCVLMSFIGDENPAPTLAELDLPQDKWQYVYSLVLGAINKLYFKGGLVHGDLSEHNILWWKNKCWFIDFSQMVPKDHIYAMEYLRRDCKTLTKFFETKLLHKIRSPQKLYTSISSQFY